MVVDEQDPQFGGGAGGAVLSARAAGFHHVALHARSRSGGSTHAPTVKVQWYPAVSLNPCAATADVTVLAMPEIPTVSLRPRTDDDLDVLFGIAADLDTWEERNPGAPGPLTRERFDARLARAADSDAPEDTVTFVVDVDGAAVGGASLFDFDSFARHAEAGISLVPRRGAAA